ncbi:hypothetical protein [Thermogemmatispora sp.]|uniref:hypothetical protein n=1 Tax=Thermogemmatispora sp. TaxID=1968838 RepID=UPI001DA97DED|nr:hypothetical protein [Thermogemmatispora sp.]MBX5449142.1 hypothetical protein [Thermogemmatispora sp.]
MTQPTNVSYGEFPAERLALYIHAIRRLPASEQAAVLWHLWHLCDCCLELAPVIAALRKAGLDPEQMPLPQR